jgi:hypothetical protein
MESALEIRRSSDARRSPWAETGGTVDDDAAEDDDEGIQQ